jgi:tetratricopeptide (TPR) repeat protein
MGLFGFFNKSKFSKMSAQEKAREQGYAYLLCIEYAAESNKTEKGNDKVSDEDLKILSIASEAINIGSEYLDCELRKSNFFDDAEDGNHFKEVLSSLDLKNKRLAIKQMLIVYSNREKLENLLDENGDYILKGKYMTPIEKIAYLMGINEEVEGLVKDMIYEINKLELNDSELGNSENDLTKVISKSDEEDALKHLVIGISKYDIENYEGAIEDYNKSIELNPNNARTYLEIGNAKLKLNDYKGAVLDYSKSIEIDSNNADAYHNRSIAKSKLADYQGVIDDCTKTIEIDNNYTRAYFNRGTAYANLQEFMEAIGDMNKVMELEPNNSNAFKNRGICMYEFEQYDSALKDLNKAMELDPNSNAYITIDKIKEELLNIEVESTNKIINTVETNYEFKNKIEGFIKNEKIKNFELTFSISKWYGHTPFKCSGEFEGHNFTSEIVEVAKWGICEHNYKDLNKLLNDIKDYEIEVLHKHLDIDIISEDEDFEIEFIKWEEGTPDEFIEEIEEEWGAFDIRDNSTEEEQLDFIYKEGAVIDGIRILLSNDDSTFELSWIYSKENEENDKVISALKHASEFNKDLLDEAINKISNAHIDNDKSYDYYENGQYQEGIESVKKALEVIPNRSNFLDTLAIGYYYLGDYNSAIEASNNCIDFDIEEDSENAEHYFNRGNILLKMNEIVKAKDDFEKALEIDNSFEPAIEAINNLIKDDYLDLINFLNERPNIKRIFNEFCEAIRNDYSIRQYLIEGDFLTSTDEERNIVIWSFTNIKSFLQVILEKNEDIEIKRDFDALEEAINILSEVKNEIDLITDKIKIELSELSDKTKGELYDYTYWFDVVCNRAKSHSISIYGELNNENINKLSDGHCEEYHYRMIENNDIEKAEFITPRIISFALIYEKLLSINQSKLSSDDISKLEVLKFHSISSLYGSIKFALEDITEGKKLVNVIYPNYIEELTRKSHNNETEDESEESIRLFSPKVRFLLNGLIINKIQESIPQKNTSEFVNLIKLVNQILPVDNSNEIDENIEIYDLINAEIALFNNEQTLLLQRLFSVLIIYSKQFLYVDLLIYVIELINKFGIEISDDIENDINETEIVFEIVERLKAKFSIFNFVETLKSRLYSGIIQNEEELFEVIANEFSIGIFLGEDEKIRNATEGLEIHIKRAFEMIGASKMIKFDVDYLATILNEHDDDRFYGFDYVENYHTIYLSIYNCLIESSGKELKME